MKLPSTICLNHIQQNRLQDNIIQSNELRIHKHPISNKGSKTSLQINFHKHPMSNKGSKTSLQRNFPFFFMINTCPLCISINMKTSVNFKINNLLVIILYTTSMIRESTIISIRYNLPYV